MDPKERIAKMVNEEIAPALGMDGIGVEVIELTDGVVRLRLENGCLGCPGTIMTIVHSLEQELRKRVPEVECVEFV